MIFFSELIQGYPPRFRSQPQLSVRWGCVSWMISGMGKETPEMEIVVLLMEDILHHIGCIKPCKSWDKLPLPQLMQDFCLGWRLSSCQVAWCRRAFGSCFGTSEGGKTLASRIAAFGDRMGLPMCCFVYFTKRERDQHDHHLHHYMASDGWKWGNLSKREKLCWEWSHSAISTARPSYQSHPWPGCRWSSLLGSHVWGTWTSMLGKSGKIDCFMAFFLDLSMIF